MIFFIVLMLKLTNPSKVWHGWCLTFLMLISCTHIFFLCALSVPLPTRYLLTNKQPSENPKRQRKGDEAMKRRDISHYKISSSVRALCKIVLLNLILYADLFLPVPENALVSGVTLHMLNQSPGLYGLTPHGKWSLERNRDNKPWTWFSRKSNSSY